MLALDPGVERLVVQLDHLQQFRVTAVPVGEASRDHSVMVLTDARSAAIDTVFERVVCECDESESLAVIWTVGDCVDIPQHVLDVCGNCPFGVPRPRITARRSFLPFRIRDDLVLRAPSPERQPQTGSYLGAPSRQNSSLRSPRPGARPPQRTLRKRGVISSLHFEFYAAQGACGKPPFVPHNRRPKPETRDGSREMRGLWTTCGSRGDPATDCEGGGE